MSGIGPGSIAWELCRERAIVLAAPRTVMLQYAHPGFAAASAAYSARDDRPGARFERALRTLAAMIFEPPERVAKHARRVGRLHGSLEEGRGRDPAALAWILVTLIDAVVTGADLAVGPLSDREVERLLLEARGFGAHFDVRAEDVPATRRELEARIERAARDELVVGEEARAMWRFLGAGTRGGLVRRWTAAILPRALASALGSELGAIERRAWRAAGRRVARGWTRLPAELRFVDAYRRAIDAPR